MLTVAYSVIVRGYMFLTVTYRRWVRCFYCWIIWNNAYVTCVNSCIQCYRRWVTLVLVTTADKAVGLLRLRQCDGLRLCIGRCFVRGGVFARSFFFSCGVLTFVFFVTSTGFFVALAWDFSCGVLLLTFFFWCGFGFGFFLWLFVRL